MFFIHHFKWGLKGRYEDSYIFKTNLVIPETLR